MADGASASLEARGQIGWSKAVFSGKFPGGGVALECAIAPPSQAGGGFML